MKISSPAGNFIITFEKLEPVDGAIQITGKFGAWDAKASMPVSEFWGIIRMAMTPAMIGLLLKSLFGLSRPKDDGESDKH